MSEYEVLSLLGAIQGEQTVIIAQIVSLHLAMIVGIFYFLHRSGLVMKVAVLAVYTLAYALFIGLLSNLSLQLLGARADLISITEDGGELSGLGDATLQQTTAVLHNWVSLVANIMLLVLWIGTVAFLFFWKRPREAA
jgi:hypothetical protein